MADIARRTAGRIEVVESIDQQTKNAGEDIDAGQSIHEDANGNWVRTTAANAAGAAAPYISARKARLGDGLTGIRIGVFDGYDLSGLAFNAPVYLSNTLGELADAAGTVAVVVGRVTSVRATTFGSVPDKILKVVAPI